MPVGAFVEMPAKGGHHARPLAGDQRGLVLKEAAISRSHSLLKNISRARILPKSIENVTKRKPKSIKMVARNASEGILDKGRFQRQPGSKLGDDVWNFLAPFG